MTEDEALKVQDQPHKRLQGVSVVAADGVVELGRDAACGEEPCGLCGVIAEGLSGKPMGGPVPNCGGQSAMLTSNPKTSAARRQSYEVAKDGKMKQSCGDAALVPGSYPKKVAKASDKPTFRCEQICGDALFSMFSHRHFELPPAPPRLFLVSKVRRFGKNT